MEHSIEEIIEMLKSIPEVSEVKQHDHDGENLCGTLNFRDITFKVRDQDYHIQWWSNVSYLMSGNLKVAFNKMYVGDTYPSYKYNNHLMFDYYSHEIVALIGLELMQYD